MNRTFTWINFVGVIVLGALCALQWYAQRRLHLELTAQARELQARGVTLKDQAATVQGLTRDLEAFRSRWQETSASAAECEQRSRRLEREAALVTSERDQLKVNLDHWRDAVAERDLRLQEWVGRLEEMARERNDVVEKFNALAERHGRLVTELNEARRASAAAVTNAAAR